MSGFNQNHNYDDYLNDNNNSNISSNNNRNMYGNSSSDQNGNSNTIANSSNSGYNQYLSTIAHNRATGSAGGGRGGGGAGAYLGGNTATTANDLSSLSHYHSQYHQFQPSLYHQYQTNYPQQFHHPANMYYQDANASIGVSASTSASANNNANQNNIGPVPVPGYTLHQPFYKKSNASNTLGNLSNNSNGAAPCDNASATATATATAFDYLNSLTQPQTILQQQQNKHQLYQTNNYASTSTQQKSKDNQSFLQYQSYLPSVHGYDLINNSSSKNTSASNSGTKLASINNNNSKNNKNTTTNNNNNNNNQSDTTSVSPSFESIEIENFANKFFAPNNNNRTVTNNHHHYKQQLTREQQLVSSLLDPLYNLKNDDTSSSNNKFHDIDSSDIFKYCAEVFKNEPNFPSTTTDSINTTSHDKTMSQISSNSSKILDNFTLSIISLSASPLSAKEIIDIVSFRCQEVESRFIPCVDFLVTCQQELRHGLALAIQKNRRGRSCYTAQDVRPKIFNMHFMCFVSYFFSLILYSVLHHCIDLFEFA
jgi:hypothetical protein